jgi:dihydrofolate reductase
MGKIVMSGPQNVSLDGVVQDPDGAEGFELGGWFREFGGEDLAAWNQVALEEALSAEAWLLGRRSYEFFGMRWRPRSGELADRLNTMPKYVVSSTLRAPEWNNTHVIAGDPVAEIRRLKEQPGKDIVQYGFGRLAHTMLRHGLLDELRLWVHPFVIGSGGPQDLLYRDSPLTRFRLVDATPLESGIVVLAYAAPAIAE